MASNNVVQLEIQSLLDRKGFDDTKKQLKTIGVEIKKTGEDGEFSLSKIDSSAKKTGRSFVELAAKITAAYMAVSKMITAYVDDAKANAKLTLALKNNTDAATRHGKSVSDLTKEYNDFASAQQAATGIGDEVTLSLMGTLTTLGTMPKDLKRVTAAFQDMEAATGMSADSMARVWARLQEAPDEALGALTRVGVKIRKEHLAGMDVEQQRIFVLEKLEKAFGGQAKAMADATGGIAQAKAAFGDFQEVLGKVIVDIIGPLAKGLSTILSAFNSLPGPVQGAIVAVGGLTAAFFALSGAINLTPVGWILTATAALGGLAMMANGLDPLKKQVDEINSSLSTLNSEIDQLNAKDAGNQRQLQTLKNLKRGTSAYESEVRKLIETNAELANSGITVKSSYDDIFNALKRLDTASAIVKNNRLKDIAQSAMGSYWQSASQLTLGANNLPLSTEANDALADSANKSLITAARALAMAGKFRFHEDQTGPIDLSTHYGELQALADFKNALQEMANEGLPSGMQMPLLLNQQQLQDAYNAARALRDRGRDYIPDNASDTTGGGSQAIQEAVDVWQMRINLMEDEFEKRRQQTYKDYLAETANIEKLTIDEEDKLALLDAVDKKYLTDRQKIESDYEDKLREERVRAYNEALSMMQQGLSLGTSIIKKDWKSAIGETLSTIPGVGPTLSGVFGAAVDFFGELFGSRSKTVAEKLGDWLEAAVQKFDRSFTRSETYSKLFGDLDLSAIEAEIDSISTALDESLAKIGLGAGTTRDQFKQYYDIIKGASFRGLNKSDYAFGAGPSDNIFNNTYTSVLGWSNGGGLNTTQMSAYVENIRKLFRDVYGDASDEMLKMFGLTGTDRQIAQQWFKVKNQLDGINGSIIAIAENTATWYDKLEESQLKKGLASTKDELDRINKKFEIGEITLEEMVKRSSEQIDNALEYLRTLEPTQEVLDAIDDLLLQQINLQKQLNDESAKGLDIEDEKLRNLLAQREELERNIAAGYVREGTSDTVSQQAAILRQIIARAKELGLSRDDYFQYEEALANLMSGFAGSSYTGMTGYGYTPGVEDFVGNMPIGSREFQTSMNTARASRSSTSNITTNTQNVTINGQAMVPNQEFVDGLRVLTKRVYGKDIIK